jgi:hypothetical protein
LKGEEGWNRIRTYQPPAGGLAIGKLVVGGQNEEDLGRHCDVILVNWGTVMILEQRRRGIEAVYIEGLAVSETSTTPLVRGLNPSYILVPIIPWPHVL